MKSAKRSNMLQKRAATENVESLSRRKSPRLSINTDMLGYEAKHAKKVLDFEEIDDDYFIVAETSDSSDNEFCVKSTKSKSCKNVCETGSSDRMGNKSADIQTVKDVKKSQRKKSEWFCMITRSSPLQLHEGIKMLKENQREAVKKMGFSRLLNFSVDGIPGKLGHYVVDHFDPDSMEIKLPNGNIKVDKQSIHHLLGIPCKGIQLHEQLKEKKLNATVQQCKDRYPGKFVPTTKLVASIDNADDEDTFFFRLDFIMLFVTVMVECLNHGRCKDNVLKRISGETRFEDIDWCGYIIDASKRCKVNWRRCDPNRPFSGPLTILTLLYVDSTVCSGVTVDSSIYPLAYWNMKRLKLRQSMEIKAGGFGKGRYKGLTKIEFQGVDNTMSTVERSILKGL